MFPLLLLLFIVVPIVEIFVIIQVGEAIGVLPTIALLIADSILGAMLWRAQGRTAWRRFNAAIAEGRVPAREVLDGVAGHLRRRAAADAGVRHRHLRHPLPAAADAGGRAQGAACAAFAGRMIVERRRRRAARGRAPRRRRRRRHRHRGRPADACYERPRATRRRRRAATPASATR